jgi:hypothetical protein
VIVKPVGDVSVGAQVLTTRNVSRYGMFVISTRPLNQGQYVRIHGTAPDGSVLACDGFVWRSVGHGMVIVFSKPCTVLDGL